MIYGMRNCWQGMMLREFQRIFLENLLARFAEKLGAWTKCVRLVNLQHCNSRTCAAAKDSTPSSKRNQRQLITVTLRIRFFFFSGAMASMATSMLCLCVWWEAPESSLGSMFQENCRFFNSQNIWSRHLQKKSKCPVHKLDFCHMKGSQKYRLNGNVHSQSL